MSVHRRRTYKNSWKIQKEFEDTQRVIRERKPKKDRPEEFDDTTGVISVRTSEKDIQ